MLRRFRTALAPTAAAFLIALAGCGDDVTEVTQVYEPPPSETTAALCQDDADNDGDTLADCDDPDCAGFTFCAPGTELTAADCQDAADNDADGATDCADADCQGFVFCLEPTEDTSALCADGLDNDSDGATDCDDDGCQGFVFCLEPTEDTSTLCADGLDNDADGATDCDDAGCAAFCAPGTELTAVACQDGADNDGDGATDCDDPDCQGFVFCLAPTEDTSTLCADGADNDGDGATDCDDPDCGGFVFCVPGAERDSLCADGADNDGDGHVDCNDPGCWDSSSCQVFNGYPVKDSWGATWDGIERPAATRAAAAAECTAAGGRLPTVTELYRVSAAMTGDVGSSYDTNLLWSTLTNSQGNAMAVRLDVGTVTAAAPVTQYHFRCIWPNVKPGAFDEAACLRQPSETCATVRRVYDMDTVDRPALDFVAASQECNLMGGSLPLLEDWSDAIHSGAFTGFTASWRWSGDAVYGSALNHPLVQFDPAQASRWAFGAGTGSMALPTAAYPFRCIGKRSAAEGVDPVNLPCNEYAGCFKVTARRSPIWADAAPRGATATHAIAASICEGMGGSLPTLLEFQELVHAGLPFSPSATDYWHWTSTPLYAGGAANVIARRHTFTDPRTWYAVGGSTGSVWWNAGTTNYGFRCVWHQTVQSSPPTCALGEEPSWDGAQFTCATRVPGDDGGQATAGGFADRWGNAWDATERTAATHAAATSTCEGAGGRLPTPTELHRIRAGDINPAPGASSTSLLWTRIPAPSAGVMVTARLSDGATSSVGDSTPSPFRCVWPASRGNVFGGNACAGDPGTAGSPLDPCFRTGRHVTDRLDRPLIYAASAAEECSFYGGSLVGLRSFEQIVHGGAPNGDGTTWLWLAEPVYTGAAYAVATARWTGTGATTWFWSGTTTTGSAELATSGARYRCVFNDLLR